MKSEVVNRRIPGFGQFPKEAVRMPGIVGEAALRPDKAVGELNSRANQAAERVKKALHRDGVEQLVVPIGLETDKFRRSGTARSNSRPGRMAGFGTVGEPVGSINAHFSM